MSKFAAHDTLSIYAVADTAEGAIAKARIDALEPAATFEVAQIEDDLAAWIESNGWHWQRTFDVRQGFIVDTTEEGSAP